MENGICRDPCIQGGMIIQVAYENAKKTESAQLNEFARLNRFVLC